MLKITVDGTGMTTLLDNLRTAVDDFTPVWPQVRQIFMAFMRKQFESEGAYAGVGWVPLSPAYAARKARLAPGKTILRFHDTLYGSLTSAGNAQQVYRTGPAFMEFGTRVFYARIHQTGSLTVPNRPPKRVVLPLPTQAEGERIADAILAFMLKRARGAR